MILGLTDTFTGNMCHPAAETQLTPIYQYGQAIDDLVMPSWLYEASYTIS